MAYSRFSRILFACISAFAAVAYAAAEFVSDAVREFWTERWHLDAKTSLAADRLGREMSIEPQQHMRRSRSFVERAGLHRLFRSGGFADPVVVATS